MATHGDTPAIVNRTVYQELGERWYAAKNDPIALLRAESRSRNPWLAGVLEQTFLGTPCRVLDLGCGAGFLANDLARRGHTVIGLDAAAAALDVAARHDATKTVRWVTGDAVPLPFEAGSFDAVCAMDFLEHVDRPEDVVAEASRVLLPGGLFFFHTFDRSLLSWLLVIKGVAWFVSNTPRDLHVLSYFIKPEELRRMCADHDLAVQEIRGFRPRLNAAFMRMLRTGTVEDDFAFDFSAATFTGYLGFAKKLA